MHSVQHPLAMKKKVCAFSFICNKKINREKKILLQLLSATKKVQIINYALHMCTYF